MNASKRWRILYWVFTLVAVVPTVGSGIPNCSEVACRLRYELSTH